MEKRVRWLAVAAAILLVIGSSLACSISGEVNIEGPEITLPSSAGGEEEASPEAPASPVPTEPPQPAEPTAAPETVESEGEGAGETTPPPPPPPDQDPLEVADIPELQITTLDPHAEGLGHLGTFRQRMTVRFTGQESNYTGIYYYEAEVNTADQAVHATVTAEGPAAQALPSNQVQAIWIGTRLWIKVGNQPWLPIPESVAEARFDEQMYTAGDFLPYIQHFQRVEPDEVVNDIPCAHYTYNVQNVPTQYGTVSGHGDVYVALEGGYVVRYTLEGSGTFEDYFQGSGTISLVYDTYDVGAPISISPPHR